MLGFPDSKKLPKDPHCAGLIISYYHIIVLPRVQVVSLFPLFPGTNEMDQIEKIHAIMGTPPPEVLARMKKHSTHIEYDFNPKVGSSQAATARRILPI